MRTHNLALQDSLLNTFLEQIRSKEVQKDRMRFRRNMERIGEVMAYEISKSLAYSTKNIATPLGIANVNTVDNDIVLGTIFRAGLPFHQGFLSYFDNADNAFISAYRKYKDALKFEVFIEYIASPDLTGKTLILVDPMLASGSSMELAYNALLTRGKPKEVHFATIIASQYAVDYLSNHFAEESNISLWSAAIDPELNAHSYIIPGLGDAGDLAFGEKL
ncbi:MAG: uracil phosphoribosyltransferase [Paludibacteraceae bacterium]|jgi:uracil phosphoribosyltransferase|nr:uracil phosphoribosyltransferase [Paludibacteraceae bacterium]NLK92966.1 uracil phosphoribosyltransferase [Bacteroidales bacterium]MBP6436100.1 uracil phosphoribosyltransferase [Paludibacteraceae bacterium]MBP7210999.1 uracil phosphoribosyltransferase [Paludibacteraceae bacterium]MBP8627345.1 uracil phosphoribosyltransferase [Paludibacteraceae bacterium]